MSTFTFSYRWLFSVQILLVHGLNLHETGKKTPYTCNIELFIFKAYGLHWLIRNAILSILRNSVTMLTFSVMPCSLFGARFSVFLTKTANWGIHCLTRTIEHLRKECTSFAEKWHTKSIAALFSGCTVGNGKKSNGIAQHSLLTT